MTQDVSSVAWPVTQPLNGVGGGLRNNGGRKQPHTRRPVAKSARQVARERRSSASFGSVNVY
jgi:hypothetical protein